MTLVTSRFVVFFEIIFLNKRRKRKKTEKNTQNTLAVLSSVFKFVPGDEQKDKSPRAMALGWEFKVAFKRYYSETDLSMKTLNACVYFGKQTALKNG